MESDELKERVADLEQILITKLRPTFLIITDPNIHYEGDIYIVISTLSFKNMSIQKRIKSVFSLILKYIPDIIKNRLVVIQAYSGSEIEEVIEDAFSGDNY